MRNPTPVLLMVRELHLGGIERDVSKLARRLDRSRFDPHVACFIPGGYRAEEIAAASIPIVHFPVASVFSPASLPSAAALLAYVRQHSIRLVHAFDAPTDLFGVPLAIAAGVEVALTSQLWLPSLIPARLQRAVSFTHLLASGVYVNCEAVKERLVEDEGIPASRIHVCRNGVDTQVFFPRPQARQAGREGEPVTIGSVAVLRPEKGLSLLLEAFARLHRLDGRVQLLIVGSGPMLPELEAQRRELGIDELRCRFHPATERVADLLRTMDIFVLPSLSEAFSNALLEAMACGCCPVASRVGGTPELIADGERGLLFETGNAGELAEKLSRLVADAGLRERLSTAAAAFARGQLNIERAVQRLEAIYGELLGRAG